MLENEEISFSLPANPVVLSFLKMKMSDKIKSIELGMKFMNMGNNQIQCWNNEEWTTRLDREREKLEEEINNYKILLEKEKDNSYNMKLDSERHMRKMSDEMRKNISIQYEDIIKDLKNDINKKNSDIINLNDKCSNSFKSAYLEFEKKIEEKEKIWEERLNKEKKENDRLISRGQNSTLLGQDGEILTLHELNRRFPKAEIEDTHKQKGRGDFIFKEFDFTMLVETKNYKNNVTKPEIEKFYRDMDTNHDIQCGVLISLKSGVCSKEDFHLEVREGKPILFLHNISKNFDNLGLAIKLFKLILKKDTIDLSCKEKIEKIRNSVPIIKRNWNTMRQKVKKFERELAESISEQESQILLFFELLGLTTT